MKTNKKVISEMVNVATTLVEEKPFSAVDSATCLAREIIGYNNADTKLIALQNEIEKTKGEKGTRKKAIDDMLKIMWQNGAKMVEGTGVTKCPIRIELRRVLDETNLAKRTKDNIITAVSFALNNKKPYDIKAPEREAARKKAEKEKQSTPPASGTTPPASGTTPPATPPASGTTPPATPPASGTTPPATPEKATQYVQQMAQLLASAFTATEARRMLGDEHATTYGDIINDINDIMDLIATLK